MKNIGLKLALAFCAVLPFASCGEDDPVQQPTLSHQQWPAKKISRIVQSAGAIDFMTFDFSWTGDLLTEIRYTYYDGSDLGRTVLEYTDGRIDRIYPFDKDGVAYPDGAMHYHYDADGRLVRQNFLLPERQDNNLCQATYNNAVPCELVYNYMANGKVSEVLATKTLDDGSTESFSYRFTWVDDNVTAITRLSAAGQRTLFSGMQYDDKPNPMAFPLGIETMGTDIITESVWGNAVLFLGYAFSLSANNMTTLLGGNGQCTFTYDEDGYILAKDITVNGQTTTYSFTYCNQ